MLYFENHVKKYYSWLKQEPDSSFMETMVLRLKKAAKNMDSAEKKISGNNPVEYISFFLNYQQPYFLLELFLLYFREKNLIQFSDKDLLISFGVNATDYPNNCKYTVSIKNSAYVAAYKSNEIFIRTNIPEDIYSIGYFKRENGLLDCNDNRVIEMLLSKYKEKRDIAEKAKAQISDDNAEHDYLAFFWELLFYEPVLLYKHYLCYLKAKGYLNKITSDKETA